MTKDFIQQPPVFAPSLVTLLRLIIVQKKWHVFITLSLFLLVAILNMVPPIMTGYLVKKGIVYAQMSIIYTITILLILVTITRGVLHYFKLLLFKHLQTHCISHIQTFIMERMLQLPLAFFENHMTGELTHRVLIVESLANILSDNELGAYISLLCTFIGFSFMVFVDSQLTICILLAVLMFLALSMYSSFHILPKLEAYLELSGKAQGFLFQSISGMLRIKSLGKEATVSTIACDKYLKARHTLFEAHQLGIWRFTLFKNIQLIMMLLLFALITLRTSHLLPFETFIVFFSAYVQFIVSFVLFTLNSNSLVSAITTYKRIKTIITTPVEPVLSKKIFAYDAFPGDISIKNVCFRYETSHTDVLKNINCLIPYGQHTAIVGLSGSGKSTLLKLILGLYSPQSGEIRFDGYPIQELELSQLYPRISMVLQDSKLVHGSILENIMGIEGNEEDAWRIAKLIGLDVLINSLPMKMHTLVSQHMNLISGGQRQLILLAHALAANPRLLILDEATNSLDNISQARVVQYLQRLTITRISIAHRLSTIKNADQIIVLHQGDIIQRGNYQDLIQQKKGYFYQLAQRQFLDNDA